MEQANYQYKLSEIRLNDNTVLAPGKLTVLVGPNNSGKSRALKEIAAFTTLPVPHKGIVVSSISVNYPSNLSELRQAYDVERYQREDGYWVSHTLAPELTQEHQFIGGGIWPSGYEDPSTTEIP